MNYQKVTQKNTLLVSIAPNEEIVEKLTEFVKKQGIQSGYILGIGAVKSVRLGHYSVATKTYTEKKIKKPLEMTNLTGIITTDKIHLHGTFGSQMFKAYSGHVARAVVSAACEIIIVETEEEITRQHSEEIGLDLLNLN